MTPSNDTARLALTQWTRAATQRNIDALVKVGDYYYHGLGVSEQDEATRLEKAAMYYQSAADTQMSALAMWNLGWMYENGIGVPQVGNFYYLLVIDSEITYWRISIWPRDTTISLWRLILRHTCLSCSPSENSICEVFGTL